MLALVEQVAATDSTVLLLGETGVGKELFASRIHDLSARRGRKMGHISAAGASAAEALDRALDAYDRFRPAGQPPIERGAA